MKKETIINLSLNQYTSLQEAIDQAAAHDTIILDAIIYDEKIEINKPLKFIGQLDTVIKLNSHQMMIHHAGTVTFENIRIDITPRLYDASLLVVDSVLTCSACTFTSASQHRELFSCLWIEASSFILMDSTVDMRANFLKSVNGECLNISNNQMNLIGGTTAIEVHAMKTITVTDNDVTSEVDIMRGTKIVDFQFEHNKIQLLQDSPSKKIRLFVMDGLEHGELFSVSNNHIKMDQSVHMIITNGLSLNRKIVFSNNELFGNTEHTSWIKLDHLQGLLVLENNTMETCNLAISQCSELILKDNKLLLFDTKQLNLLMAMNNQFLKRVIIDGTQHVTFKKNEITNDRSDYEALKLSTVDKFIFEQNKLNSVDHGITLLNGGENLEIVIQKNEFIACKKRGINIASTRQKKYLKTEVRIQNNVFQRNDKAIYIDDRNLKACHVIENYFSDNKEAIVIFGGKSTSDIKVSQNYLDNTNQKIELRSAQVCTVSHNQLSDSKLHVRGCDEIIITGNRLEKHYGSKGKSLHNDVSVKAGGYLTVCHNTMLIGKMRQEKKEVLDQLNITSFERNPAINIYENQPLNGERKKGLFEPSRDVMPNTYPDESLLSAIRYQIHAKEKNVAMKIDDVLKGDFFKLRDALVSIRDAVTSENIKHATTLVLNQFNMELFADRDSNDIYRFIVKSNETIEMLKLYSSLENETDNNTEDRIVAVMNNYQMVVNQFLNEKTENAQDKLNAQLKLLENLL